LLVFCNEEATTPSADTVRRDLDELYERGTLALIELFKVYKQNHISINLQFYYNQQNKQYLMDLLGYNLGAEMQNIVYP
jgi:hypothetical protein